MELVKNETPVQSKTRLQRSAIITAVASALSVSNAYAVVAPLDVQPVVDVLTNLIATAGVVGIVYLTVVASITAWRIVRGTAR